MAKLSFKKDKTSAKNEDKEYKKKTRRLFLLMLLLMFMIFLLGGSTFAWFSSNKHATIESIDINVATVTGLQVSVDAYDWKNEITKEELVNAINTYPTSMNQFPDTLSNVSTAGNVTNGKLDMFYGVTSREKNEGFTLTAYKQEEMRCTGDEECESNKHYIAFDLFLLVTTPATIGITANSNVIPQEGTEDRGAQNAARVGFVVEGTVGAGNPRGAQLLNGGNTSYIWEPNYDVHTDAAVMESIKVYGVSTSTSGASRIPYKGVNSEFFTPIYIDQTDKSSYFTSVTPKVATTKEFSSNQPLLNIPAGISKVRVYMWLEGQDVDMENRAAGTALTYNLELAMLN